MPDGHHFAVAAPGRDLELVRDRRGCQGVVTAGEEVLREPVEQTSAVVADHARLAVHEGLGRVDLPAEHLDDRLVPEADAERRDARREAPDDLWRRTGVRGSARPGGDDEMARLHPFGLVGVDCVVPAHLDLGAELPEQVRQVVGEGVVVVHEEDHPRASARSIARSSAASFRRHSSCSSVGFESATMPAPAWRYATPSWSRIVRIAMHVSTAPSGRKYPTAPAYGPRR